mgnify:CR=1 FL=1
MYLRGSKIDSKGLSLFLGLIIHMNILRSLKSKIEKSESGCFETSNIQYEKSEISNIQYVVV